MAHWGVAASCCSLILVTAAEPGLTQNPADTFVFDDARPLAKAAQELEQRFGWIVTYEDPPYEFGADVRDVTSVVRKDRSSAKVLIPNGVPFVFSLEGTTAATAPASTLDALVQAYARSGNVGSFRVISAPPVFHLVPTEMRDPRGLPVPLHTLLDTAISLPSGRRSLLKIIEELAAELTRATGIPVMPGMMSLNFMIQTHVEGGATGVAARDFLRRILLESGQTMSWRLLYGPGLKHYVLNVHFVKGPGGPQ